MNVERRTRTSIPGWLHRSSFIVHRFPRAFSLIELVTAMAIISILLLAIGSALSFSIKVSSGQGAVDQANLLSAADAADQITDDLHVAMNFMERTSTSMTFSVPDRVSAGTPNQVRYAWDGVSGHGLTRQFCPSNTTTLNAASATYAPVTLLNGVTSFSTNYLTRQMGSPAATENGMLVTGLFVLGSNVNYNIDSNHWLSQCVTLTLPLLTSSYSITRIQFYLKSSGPQDSTLLARVTTASGSKPVTTLEEEPLYESALSNSYEYAEVKFKNLTGLTAGQPICVVLGYNTGTAAGGTAQYQSSLISILSGGAMSLSSNGGSTWSNPSANNNFYMNVYGTIP